MFASRTLDDCKPLQVGLEHPSSGRRGPVYRQRRYAPVAAALSAARGARYRSVSAAPGTLAHGADLGSLVVHRLAHPAGHIRVPRASRSPETPPLGRCAPLGSPARSRSRGGSRRSQRVRASGGDAAATRCTRSSGAGHLRAPSPGRALRPRAPCEARAPPGSYGCRAPSPGAPPPWPPRPPVVPYALRRAPVALRAAPRAPRLCALARGPHWPPPRPIAPARGAGSPGPQPPTSRAALDAAVRHRPALGLKRGVFGFELGELPAQFPSARVRRPPSSWSS